MDASRAGTALRLCGALLLVSLIGHTTGARANDQAPPKKPNPQVACVKSQSEARFDGYGYDHWVHLTNACKVAVRCSVKTNANPEGTVVGARRGRAEERDDLHGLARARVHG